MLSGDYVVVAEVAEFGYASSMDLDYRRVQSVDCGTTSLPIPSLSIQTDENDVPVFELEVTTMDEQTDVQWLEICKASVQLWNLDLTEKVLEKNVLCVVMSKSTKQYAFLPMMFSRSKSVIWASMLTKMLNTVSALT